MTWLRNSDASRVVSYERSGKGEDIVVVINFSNRPFVGSVEVASGQSFQDITPDVRPPLPPDAPAPEVAKRARINSLPSIAIDAWGYRIFIRRMKP